MLTPHDSLPVHTIQTQPLHVTLTSRTAHMMSFLCLFLLAGAGSSVVAQTNVLDSDPLRARKLIVYDMVGAYMGMSFNGQTGTIISDCQCEFTGGASVGFAGGFMYERLTRSSLIWGVGLSYENRSFDSKFREREGVDQTAPSTGRSYLVPVTFSNTASVSLQYLSAMPYLKYVFAGPFFARAGANLSYIFSSNLTHTKSLESDIVTFPNGETGSVQIPGAENGSVELQNGPIEDLSSFQIGLSTALGAEFKLSKKVFLGPVLQYTFPFTSVSNTGPFSVQAFQMFIEGRIIL